MENPIDVMKLITFIFLYLILQTDFYSNKKLWNYEKMAISMKTVVHAHGLGWNVSIENP